MTSKRVWLALLIDQCGVGTLQWLGVAVGWHGSEASQKVVAKSKERARLDVPLQWLACVEDGSVIRTC